MRAARTDRWAWLACESLLILGAPSGGLAPLSTVRRRKGVSNRVSFDMIFKLVVHNFVLARGGVLSFCWSTDACCAGASGGNRNPRGLGDKISI